MKTSAVLYICLFNGKDCQSVRGRCECVDQDLRCCDQDCDVGVRGRWQSDFAMILSFLSQTFQHHSTLQHRCKQSLKATALNTYYSSVFIVWEDEGGMIQYTIWCMKLKHLLEETVCLVLQEHSCSHQSVVSGN